jgi:tRNA-binding protein
LSENDFKVAPVKAEISLADLDKIDIRLGTIVAVEEVAGSDKLLKLTVNFGDRQRTILSGMKQERENAAEIAGKQALFVVNLPARKMMGQISEGMLFDIGFADGIKPCLAVPEHSMPDGARAG